MIFMRKLLLNMLDEINLFYPKSKEVGKWKDYVKSNIHDRDSIPTALHKLLIGANRTLPTGRLDKRILNIIRKNILSKNSK